MTADQTRAAGMVVVGGGIAGITTAIEAAEAGQEVLLLEKEHYLGGRVARMNEYFPKLCPPGCGLEINFKRLRSLGRGSFAPAGAAPLRNERRVRIMTGARVLRVEGGPGGYRLEVELAVRGVSERCTACGKCVAACPVERVDDFNYGLGATTKAIYLPHPLAHPLLYAIDPTACLGESCARCVPYCAYDAIDLRARSRTVSINASALVVATGWQPYDATRLESLGFGRLENVVTNLQLERLAARTGPTGGKLVRPSDRGPVESVAFVQCAGSRDANHLPYCSSACCAASIKQAGYVLKQLPQAEVHVFYIDVRTMGMLEGFFAKAKQEPRLHLHRGKVAKVEAAGASGPRAAGGTRGRPDPGPRAGDGARGRPDRLRVVAEDTLSGQRLEREVDLVVLATGMQPAARLGEAVAYDRYGFVVEAARGPVGAGCAKRPAEAAAVVRDATGAALRAIQELRAGGSDQGQRAGGRAEGARTEGARAERSDQGQRHG